jgi:hypothetical protein
LREERRLRVFENWVLRIFGPKREEVTGDWRKLHNEELNDPYSSPNIVRVNQARRIRWAGMKHVWERGLHRVSVGKPEGKRPLGSPRRRWEDDIKIDLQVMGCECMDLVDVAQDRNRWRALVNALMNLRVPQNLGNFLTSCKLTSFSRTTLLHGVFMLVIYGIKT